MKSKELMRMRYGCVFRESGTKLRMSCSKRFFFDIGQGLPGGDTK